jgi:hypothetical protein
VKLARIEVRRGGERRDASTDSGSMRSRWISPPGWKLTENHAERMRQTSSSSR